MTKPRPMPNGAMNDITRSAEDAAEIEQILLPLLEPEVTARQR